MQAVDCGTCACREASQALSDVEVVKRVRDGETALFEILMRRYNQRLYRVARAILKDEGEAEDVMQQAYVNAYMHLDQFAERASFSTWLTKIAVYEALARSRRRSAADLHSALTGEETMNQIPTSAPDPEHQAFATELKPCSSRQSTPARTPSHRLHTARDRRLEHGRDRGVSRDQ